jgi:hypothetical protein
MGFVSYAENGFDWFAVIRDEAQALRQIVLSDHIGS